MVESARRRLDSEGGFTLIELLVVMIIISILMAVAVPVFLSQKQKAIATAAKTNAKHVQDAMESCAAGTVNGSFVQGTFTCNTAAVTTDEPSLTDLFSTGGDCGTAACVTMTAPTAAAPENYVINARTINTNGSDYATFTITRTSSSVIKTCSASGTGATALRQRVCPANTW